MFPDHTGERRGGEYSILTDNNLANPVSARHLHQDREGRFVEVPSVSSENEGRALEFGTQGVKGRLPDAANGEAARGRAVAAEEESDGGEPSLDKDGKIVASLQNL